ncbi:Alpha-L-arabinofuranosidase C precursor [Vibrio quintilis]|uniref:Alpha-L-arabinofuranosidase n=1 Tax=Vibrio quintilis TaxID=1117707 RepID=A0A1M7YV91_9VIBR|nr:Alpha-L-arabinofuranosidase C precursor [Vibrio quintilis]
MISPIDDNLVSVKDPSIVKYDGKYHVFASVVDKDGKYSSVYLNFSDWADAGKATQLSMKQTKAGSTVAPQVFYFKPHNKWYLIYQWGARYSTNTDINDPSGWSAPKTLLSNEPDGALDYWVICDDDNCYLFFSRDDGKLYRSKVSIDNFPNFTNYEVVMSEDSVGKLFEASNVYKVAGKDQYLLLVEAYGPRYFRSWTANSLDGPWTPLADTQSNPFAGEANVSFSGEKWTKDISHGEMIRAGYDQTLTIDPCHLQYLYQGRDPDSDSGGYDARPYQLGLLTAK